MLNVPQNGGLLLRDRNRLWEPTLVNSLSTRIEEIAAGGLISAVVGAWPHAAAEADLGADVAAPWVFFGGVEEE